MRYYVVQTSENFVMVIGDDNVNDIDVTRIISSSEDYLEAVAEKDKFIDEQAKNIKEQIQTLKQNLNALNRLRSRFQPCNIFDNASLKLELRTKYYFNPHTKTFGEVLVPAGQHTCWIKDSNDKQEKATLHYRKIEAILYLRGKLNRESASYSKSFKEIKETEEKLIKMRTEIAAKQALVKEYDEIYKSIKGE